MDWFLHDNGLHHERVKSFVSLQKFIGKILSQFFEKFSINCHWWGQSSHIFNALKLKSKILDPLVLTFTQVYIESLKKSPLNGLIMIKSF